MSHLDVDIVDFLLLTIYPVAALFLIEMVSRAGKIPTWVKLSAQGAAAVGFATAYVTLITAHWLTSLVLVRTGHCAILPSKAGQDRPQQDHLLIL